MAVTNCGMAISRLEKSVIIVSAHCPRLTAVTVPSRMPMGIDSSSERTAIYNVVPSLPEMTSHTPLW